MLMLCAQYIRPSKISKLKIKGNSCGFKLHQKGKHLKKLLLCVLHPVRKTQKLLNCQVFSRGTSGISQRPHACFAHCLQFLSV